MTRFLVAAVFAFVSIPLAQAADGVLAPLIDLALDDPGRTCWTDHPAVELDPDAFGDLLADMRSDGARAGHNYEVRDVGDISLVSGPWNYNTLSGDHIQSTLSAFISEHENDYDFISIFLDEHIQFGAYFSPLANDVAGIGSRQYSYTEQWGVPKLSGYTFMNGIFDYTGSVHDALFFGQEIGHRWGSYVRRDGGGSDTLGRDQSHWSFWMDTGNSTMEGNAWIETEDGVFETDHMADIGYSDLDLYLMGFMGPEEVEDWFIIRNPRVVSNPYRWGDGNIRAGTAPYYVLRQYYDEDDAANAAPIVVNGERRTVDIEDITDREGERRPEADEAQREWRMATVIMHPGSSEFDFDDYLVAEDTREELAALWEDMARGRAVLRTDLGTTGNYTLRPRNFPDEVAYEPEVLEEEVEGRACNASIASARPLGAGALIGLLLVAARRRS
jgi:hypothetical protein